MNLDEIIKQLKMNGYNVIHSEELESLMTRAKLGDSLGNLSIKYDKLFNEKYALDMKIKEIREANKTMNNSDFYYFVQDLLKSPTSDVLDFRITSTTAQPCKNPQCPCHANLDTPTSLNICCEACKN